eukprot:4928714-Prymnesium_polylepis.1
MSSCSESAIRSVTGAGTIAGEHVGCAGCSGDTLLPSNAGDAAQRARSGSALGHASARTPR